MSAEIHAWSGKMAKVIVKNSDGTRTHWLARVKTSEGKLGVVIALQRLTREGEALLELYLAAPTDVTFVHALSMNRHYGMLEKSDPNNEEQIRP